VIGQFERIVVESDHFDIREWSHELVAIFPGLEVIMERPVTISIHTKLYPFSLGNATSVHLIDELNLVLPRNHPLIDGMRTIHFKANQ